MNRHIYAAGVNRKHLAAAADNVPYWLLSATLLKKYPAWLASTLDRRTVLWDPGTFTEDAISYHGYRSYLDRYARSRDEYLQYDEIGDPETTKWYLADMRRRGYKPIPVLQPGGAVELLQEPRMAIGGLVPMEAEPRRAYLDELFYDNEVTGSVHILGMWRPEWFAPYKALSGDATTWIRKKIYSDATEFDMTGFGEQWIPFTPRDQVQITLETLEV